MTNRLNNTLVPTENRMEQAECYDAGPGHIVFYTSASPDNKSANEDKLAIIPINQCSLVLMVADGAGGHSGGDFASAVAINLISKSIANSVSDSSELRESILSGIEDANTAIMDRHPGAATTLSLVEIQNDMIRTYHAGDTEILVTGQRGRLKYQTLIHSPVGYAVEAGLLDEGDAIMHKDRHIVSNVLGYTDMHITIGSPVRLAPHDTLLIATDGLFDNLQKGEITDLIRKGPLDECAGKIIKMVSKRMFEKDSEKPSKFDDMSFILFRLNRNAIKR